MLLLLDAHAGSAVAKRTAEEKSARSFLEDVREPFMKLLSRARVANSEAASGAPHIQRQFGIAHHALGSLIPADFKPTKLLSGA